MVLIARSWIPLATWISRADPAFWATVAPNALEVFSALSAEPRTFATLLAEREDSVPKRFALHILIALLLILAMQTQVEMSEFGTVLRAILPDPDDCRLVFASATPDKVLALTTGKNVKFRKAEALVYQGYMFQSLLARVQPESEGLFGVTEGATGNKNVQNLLDLGLDVYTAFARRCPQQFAVFCASASVDPAAVLQEADARRSQQLGELLIEQGVGELGGGGEDAELRGGAARQVSLLFFFLLLFHPLMRIGFAHATSPEPSTLINPRRAPRFGLGPAPAQATVSASAKPSVATAPAPSLRPVATVEPWEGLEGLDLDEPTATTTATATATVAALPTAAATLAAAPAAASGLVPYSQGAAATAAEISRPTTDLDYAIRGAKRLLLSKPSAAAALVPSGEQAQRIAAARAELARYNAERAAIRQNLPLAYRVGEAFRSLYEFASLSTTLLFGGNVRQMQNDAALRGVKASLVNSTGLLVVNSTQGVGAAAAEAIGNATASEEKLVRLGVTDYCAKAANMTQCLAVSAETYSGSDLKPEVVAYRRGAAPAVQAVPALPAEGVEAAAPAAASDAAAGVVLVPFRRLSDIEAKTRVPIVPLQRAPSAATVLKLLGVGALSAYTGQYPPLPASPGITPYGYGPLLASAASGDVFTPSPTAVIVGQGAADLALPPPAVAPDGGPSLAVAVAEPVAATPADSAISVMPVSGERGVIATFEVSDDSLQPWMIALANSKGFLSENPVKFAASSVADIVAVLRAAGLDGRAVDIETGLAENPLAVEEFLRCLQSNMKAEACAAQYAANVFESMGFSIVGITENITAENIDKALDQGEAEAAAVALQSARALQAPLEQPTPSAPVVVETLTASESFFLKLGEIIGSALAMPLFVKFLAKALAVVVVDKVVRACASRRVRGQARQALTDFIASARGRERCSEEMAQFITAVRVATEAPTPDKLQALVNICQAIQDVQIEGVAARANLFTYVEAQCLVADIEVPRLRDLARRFPRAMLEETFRYLMFPADFQAVVQEAQGGGSALAGGAFKLFAPGEPLADILGLNELSYSGNNLQEALAYLYADIVTTDDPERRAALLARRIAVPLTFRNPAYDFALDQAPSADILATWRRAFLGDGDLRHAAVYALLLESQFPAEYAAIAQARELRDADVPKVVPAALRPLIQQRAVADRVYVVPLRLLPAEEETRLRATEDTVDLVLPILRAFVDRTLDIAARRQLVEQRQQAAAGRVALSRQAREAEAQARLELDPRQRAELVQQAKLAKEQATGDSDIARAARVALGRAVVAGSRLVTEETRQTFFNPATLQRLRALQQQAADARGVAAAASAAAASASTVAAAVAAPAVVPVDAQLPVVAQPRVVAQPELLDRVAQLEARIEQILAFMSSSAQEFRGIQATLGSVVGVREIAEGLRGELAAVQAERDEILRRLRDDAAVPRLTVEDVQRVVRENAGQIPLQLERQLQKQNAQSDEIRAAVRGIALDTNRIRGSAVVAEAYAVVNYRLMTMRQPPTENDMRYALDPLRASGLITKEQRDQTADVFLKNPNFARIRALGFGQEADQAGVDARLQAVEAAVTEARAELGEARAAELGKARSAVAETRAELGETRAAVAEVRAAAAETRTAVGENRAETQAALAQLAARLDAGQAALLQGLAALTQTVQQRQVQQQQPLQPQPQPPQPQLQPQPQPPQALPQPQAPVPDSSVVCGIKACKGKRKDCYQTLGQELRGELGGTIMAVPRVLSADFLVDTRTYFPWASMPQGQVLTLKQLATYGMETVSAKHVTALLFQIVWVLAVSQSTWEGFQHNALGEAINIYKFGGSRVFRICTNNRVWVIPGGSPFPVIFNWYGCSSLEDDTRVPKRYSKKLDPLMDLRAVLAVLTEQWTEGWPAFEPARQLLQYVSANPNLSAGAVLFYELFDEFSDGAKASTGAQQLVQVDEIKY